MKPLILAAALATALIGANGQELSPQDIAAAIEQGKAGKTLQKKCTGKSDNSFDIVAEGPFGRIMRAAKEAARKKRPFTAADVTPDMAGPWLTVKATRVETLRNPQVPEEVRRGTPGSPYRTEFVIKSKPSESDEAIVLHPIRPITYDATNSPTPRVVITRGPVPADLLSRLPMEGSDMAASFDLIAFQAIPHKDVEIYVFMSDTGGHHCKINETERKALR